MGFSKMMELLQTKNKGKIVLCNNGNFYIAVGKDAVLLSNLIDLKVTCFKPEICKVGFPIIALEKYTDLIKQKGYSYIVYYFDKEKVELEVLLEYTGKQQNLLKETNINCYTCKHSTKYYKKTDIYIQAVAKLYESEEKKDKKIWFKKKKEKIN